MTTPLMLVTPPHRETDAAHLAGLVAAYNADVDVPAPVVVDMGHGLYALSGSHRIAAMREVYADDTAAEDVCVIVDGDALHASCEGDERAREALDQLADNRVSDYSDAIRALWTYLPAEARAVLADQRLLARFTPHNSPPQSRRPPHDLPRNCPVAARRHARFAHLRRHAGGARRGRGWCLLGGHERGRGDGIARRGGGGSPRTRARSAAERHDARLPRCAGRYAMLWLEPWGPFTRAHLDELVPYHCPRCETLHIARSANLASRGAR